MECYKKDYPRPQLVRDNWTSLNGTWDFCFDDEARGERGSWYQMWPGNQAQTIEVPFTYETKRSGIGDERTHRRSGIAEASRRMLHSCQRENTSGCTLRAVIFTQRCG